ncbi:MAG: RagB/SusD family nutrient uptake outer membrane protein [Paludibacteraceae bacterium]|nr:RagB/SusD family nutrient uptake outer membrane protein [Paludibacteraceae bacterium]
MGKRYIVFLVVGAILAMPSCNFLNEEPHSGQPTEAVITSAAALRLQAVLSLYDLIGSDKDGKGLQGTYRGIYDLQTFASNEAIIPVRGGDWYDGGLWVDLHEHTWAADNECCENAWMYLYGLIGRCNRSLALIAQYSQLLTDEQRTAYEAEVRAVRAMCYTYLLDLFARVPIVTSTETEVKDIAQSERSEVFAFIWNELQQSLPSLPDVRSNSRGEYYGRVTKPVALFLLMKLALNAEVWTDDDWTDGVRPDGKDIQLSCDGVSLNAWQAVVYYGDAILNSEANYWLCTSVRECFAAYNENATENIFTIPIDPIVYKNRFKNLFRSLHYQHAAALGLGGENGSCATQETLDVFGYGTNKQDCRFNLFFFSGMVKVNGEPLILSSGDTLVYYPREVQMVLTGSPYVATAGARMRKYEYDPAAIFDGQLQNNDIVLYRLADVYLMMAEAKVRQGQSGQDEFDGVRIREALALGVEVEARVATLENIYYERWIELMWEGWHRQDMIRFDRYVEDATDRYQKVFPIPQTAIQTNTRLQQNKGYE